MSADTDKLSIRYPHDQTSTAPIWLGITSPTETEPPAAWKGAYRDLDAGRKYVWARFPEAAGTVAVWVKDVKGVRRVGTRVAGQSTTS